LLVFDSVEVLAVDVGEGRAVAGVAEEQVEHRPGELEQLVSARNRPITLVRRRTSPSERSSRFFERHRLRWRKG
jgi:hypothetical protein